MANTRISQVSFSRGEFCPPLYMRTDLEQYSIGLKTLKNGFVHQEGCVSNRFGLEYVGQVKDSSKKSVLFLLHLIVNKHTSLKQVINISDLFRMAAIF